MLRVAQRSVPGVPLAQADLHDGLPLRRRKFDGFLCALVSVFSAFHPEIARAGVDYLSNIYDVGFRDLRWHDYRVDAALVTHIPRASKYLGQPMLLIVEAERPDFRRG